MWGNRGSELVDNCEFQIIWRLFSHAIWRARIVRLNFWRRTTGPRLLQCAKYLRQSHATYRGNSQFFVGNFHDTIIDSLADQLVSLCELFGIVSFRVIRRDVGFLIVFSSHLRPSSQVAHGRSGFRITKFRVKLGLEVVQYSLV